jgi:hypothetical protein
MLHFHIVSFRSGCIECVCIYRSISVSVVLLITINIYEQMRIWWMFVLQLRTVYSRLTLSHLFCVVLPKPYRWNNHGNHVTILVCNRRTETLQTLIKKRLKISCKHSFNDYIYLLLINEEFHSNILLFMSETDFSNQFLVEKQNERQTAFQ